MTDRRMWKTGLSFGAVSEEKLYKAAVAGLDLVEISDIDDPANWSKIPEWEKKSGVKAWSFHLPFRWPNNPPVADPATFDEEYWKQTLEQDTKWIECCGQGGVKHMVIHPSLEPYKEEEREARMQAAIEHLGIDPEETLFFDDSQANLDTAAALGFYTALVPEGSEFAEILARHKAINE